MQLLLKDGKLLLTLGIPRLICKFYTGTLFLMGPFALFGYVRLRSFALFCAFLYPTTLRATMLEVAYHI